MAPRDRLRQALLVHVDWIEDHAIAYRAVLLGGISGDPEVQEMVESSGAEVAARIAEDPGIEDVSPAVRIALRGWVDFLEGACLEWLASKDISKDALVRLLAASVPAALRVAGS